VDKKEKETAYHEAGHAIADTHQGMRVRSCTIIPGGGYAGLCRTTTRLREYSSRSKFEACIISLLAGEIAQRKFDKRGVKNYHGASDRHALVDLASRVCGSNEEIEKYIAWLYVRARNLIDSPFIWGAITQLAGRLYRDKTVDGKLVRQIYFDAARAVLQKTARHRHGAIS
jgi:hypothetical protein